LCKSVAVRRPPIAAQRNQIDYAFRRPKLRAVKNTAAANENLVLREVDATSASLIGRELREVIQTDAA
jgi:hypothetical protein